MRGPDRASHISRISPHICPESAPYLACISPTSRHISRCEGLTEQAKAVEAKYEAQIGRQEEGYAKELRRQRTLWTQAEAAKREQWMAEKTKEIKDSTVRCGEM